MAMIECSHLTMGYGSQIAVEDLSFSVEEGDYLCIVGPNGSGKSTLLKGLLGLAQPKSGSISYHGVSPREIGYLPQQTPVQRDFPASVWEVVLSGCIGSGGWKPFYTAAQKDRAAEMLRRIGAESLCRRSFRALSGGSGSVCCSPAPSAPRTACSCSTNLPPLSTPGLRPSFTI